LEPTLENPFLAKYYKSGRFECVVRALPVFIAFLPSLAQGAKEVRASHAMLAAKAAIRHVRLRVARDFVRRRVHSRRNLGPFGACLARPPRLAQSRFHVVPARFQIFSDIVFAEKNFYDENFSREGYEFYLTLRKQMLSLLPAPHVVLYLDVPAEECYQRIHKLRKRVSDRAVDMS
jgi:Deoxynucleoside kinase